MNTRPRSQSRARSPSRFATCACADASSATDRLVARQAGRVGGERAGDRDALALPTAELVRVAVDGRRRGSPTRSSSSADAVVGPLRLEPPPRRTPSAICSPTLRRGLSDAYGSWNTICRPRRLDGRRAAAQRLDGASLERDAAAGERFETDRGTRERGLAAAGFADEAEDLAARTSRSTPSTARTVSAAPAVVDVDAGQLAGRTSLIDACPAAGRRAGEHVGPPPTGTSVRDGRSHTAAARTRQRGWNGQPAGTWPSAGGLPPMVGTSGAAPASGCGSASSRPRVYGCRGVASNVGVGPGLDDPAGVHDVDAGRRSADITPRSCVIRIDREAPLAAQPVEQPQDAGLHRDVQRRRRLVRDQQLRLGRPARRRSRCAGACRRRTGAGRRCSACSGSGMRTWSSSSRSAGIAAALPMPRWWRMCSVSCVPIGSIGCSDGHRVLEDHRDLAAAHAAQLLGRPQT